MTDFEIFSMVAMIFSLVLRAFQLGRSFGSRKKHKKESRHPTPIGRRLPQMRMGKAVPEASSLSAVNRSDFIGPPGSPA